jgi:hypothetical protein
MELIPNLGESPFYFYLAKCHLATSIFQGDNMIDLLVFSMDRSSQLELLLRSLQIYAKDIFKTSVLYKNSTDKFAAGYNKLISKHKDVLWIKEINRFYDHAMYALSQGKSDFIAFSTDDTVIFKEINRSVLAYALPKADNQVFSFRLGYNTIKQDIHTGSVQSPLNIHINHREWLSWPIDRYHPHENYGYPYGLDLHAFRRKMIYPILEEFEFRSTNQLESTLTTNYRHKVDELRSFAHSVAVNVPINTVTNVTTTGQFCPISKEELNSKWLDEYIIDLEDISKQKIEGSHQEIEFKFIKEN